MSCSWSWWSADLHVHPARDRLEHDAVALGQFDQLCEPGVVSVVLDVERQPDRPETHRNVAIFGHTERAAEIEVSLGTDGPAHLDAERGRDGAHRHAGTGNERLEQHVARAGEHACAAGGWMQPGLRKRPAGC